MAIDIPIEIAAKYQVSLPLRTEVDDSSNPLYLYISRSLDPAQALSGTAWQVHRVTVANGTVDFPQSSGTPSHDFEFQASAAASLTY